eukprot:2533911-Pleurochrysis_carterae.AAC.7
MVNDKTRVPAERRCEQSKVRGFSAWIMNGQHIINTLTSGSACIANAPCAQLVCTILLPLRVLLRQT